MIHYNAFINYGDRHSLDYDSSDPVASDMIPGDSCNDLIDYLDILETVDYSVYFPDIIATDNSVYVWYVG